MKDRRNDKAKIQMEESMQSDKDREKEVDYVLVTELFSSLEDDGKDFDEELNQKRKKREIFLENLREKGLEIQTILIENSIETFDLVYAPEEVIKKYATILKMKMPIKPELCKAVQLSDDIHGQDENATKVLELEQAQAKKSSWGRRLMPKRMKPKLEDMDEVFYAPYSDQREDIYDSDHERFFDRSSRNRCVEFILNREKFSDDPKEVFFDFGIGNLIENDVYSDAYPLHDGAADDQDSMRGKLNKAWANWRNFYKFQPTDAIMKYFGVKIGFYFAWLGFYTAMLVIPSIMGIFSFFYGLVRMYTDIPTEDVCDGFQGSRIMCPACDLCPFQNLKDLECKNATYRNLFDNELTVFFSFFMSIWSVLFMEFWERRSSTLAQRWGVAEVDEHEEYPRPQYLKMVKNVKQKTVNFVTNTVEPNPPFWDMIFPKLLISWVSIFFLVSVFLATWMSIQIYEAAMTTVFGLADDKFPEWMKPYKKTIIIATANIIKVIINLFLGCLYSAIAKCLTDKEFHRTQRQYDESLAMKKIVYNFTNLYTPLFYIAFFKGRVTGTPKKYRRFGEARQVECDAGGCYWELSMGMIVMFAFSQFVQQLSELGLPYLAIALKLMRGKLKACIKNTPKMKKLFMKWLRKQMANESDWRDSDMSKQPQYLQDCILNPTDHDVLYEEYSEMVLQFGYMVLFGTAFPLAPLLALINNVTEIRVDARKLLVLHRRAPIKYAKDIGIWKDVMKFMIELSVISNAFIIAVSSDFIPQTVYRTKYSEDSSLRGYVNYTLSEFYTGYGPPVNDLVLDLGDTAWNRAEEEKTDWPLDRTCYYRDFRYPPAHDSEYEPTEQFFLTWLARLAFVIVYMCCVYGILELVRIMVPDVPESVKKRIRREKFIYSELQIREAEKKKDNNDDELQTKEAVKKEETRELETRRVEEEQESKKLQTKDIEKKEELKELNEVENKDEENELSTIEKDVQKKEVVKEELEIKEKALKKKEEATNP